MSDINDQQTSAAGSVCLCVLFNHPFPSVIPLLRKIYADRFSHIRFIMPLAKSDDEDVLTSYRGSFAHQMLAVDHREALEALPCSHYLLIHDDVLLSPWLDEGNILQFLGITAAGIGFLGALDPVFRDVGEWGFQTGTLWKLLYPRNVLTGTGADRLSSVLAQLPHKEKAVACAARYGIPPETTLEYSEQSLERWSTLDNFGFLGRNDLEGETKLAELVLDLLFGSKPPAEFTIPYPFAQSGPNADLLVLPRAAFADFGHISGVLAAAGVFVEMASATALMLSCDHVRTTAETGRSLYWSRTALDPYAALDRLLEPDNLISAHPVKLSQVDPEDDFVSRIKRIRDAVPVPIIEPDMGAVLTVAPDFDPATYLALNPDVGGSPYTHFRRHGQFEGRQWKMSLEAELP